jgi:hypothetical protein
MTDIDWTTVVALLIRISNLTLWLAVAVRYWRAPTLPTPFARRVVLSVVLAGSGALVLGGFAPLGFPNDVARWMYTMFTAYAAIVAGALLTAPWRE